MLSHLAALRYKLRVIFAKAVQDMPSSDFIVPTCNDPVRVIFQDQHLLIVDKPAGLLSVPGRHPDNKDCLITRLQVEFAEARIVHRLDMATSGLMIIALDADSHRNLSRQFERREIAKEYLARVSGQVQSAQGYIDLPLACDWPNRPRQEVNFEYGKSAQTFYRRLRAAHDSSDLLLQPVTGRSHQLRVHCASMGHPILGCDFYAHSAARDRSPRLLLHASRLSFSHPHSGKPLDLGSPAPFLADCPA